MNFNVNCNIKKILIWAQVLPFITFWAKLSIIIFSLANSFRYIKYNVLFSTIFLTSISFWLKKYYKKVIRALSLYSILSEVMFFFSLVWSSFLFNLLILCWINFLHLIKFFKNSQQIFFTTNCFKLYVSRVLYFNYLKVVAFLLPAAINAATAEFKPRGKYFDIKTKFYATFENFIASFNYSVKLWPTKMQI